MDPPELMGHTSQVCRESQTNKYKLHGNVYINTALSLIFKKEEEKK